MKKILYLLCEFFFCLLAVLLVACDTDEWRYYGYPDFNTSAKRRTKQDSLDETVTTPILVVKTSKDAFLSAFVGQEWSNGEMFEMDDKGT